jgi:uncharacterized protein
MNTDFEKLRAAIVAQLPHKETLIHGPAHWARVELIGLRLAEKSGADPLVMRLFALFHDSQRQNDSLDPEHGARGAQLAAAFRSKWFEAGDRQFQQLHEACALHTDGLLSPDATIGTCWDADRLDLARIGMMPDLRFLSTAAARDSEIFQWALCLRRE